MENLTIEGLEFFKETYFKKPKKLYFRYSAMNGGKSTSIIQIAYNYEVKNKQNILVAKPILDTKGNNKIVSRIGDKMERDCDILINREESIVDQLIPYLISLSNKKERLSVLLVDEVQFLSKNNVEDLAYISSVIGIPVLAYGLKVDFQGQVFEGSSWMFAYSQDIKSIDTEPMSFIGNKEKKATMNLRLKNGLPSFEGEQVAIDGEEYTYEPVSLYEFLKAKKESGYLQEYEFNAIDFINK